MECTCYRRIKIIYKVINEKPIQDNLSLISRIIKKIGFNW